MSEPWEKYVRAGVCKCCGHKTITWSPAAIVEALRKWDAKHGRPPSANQWQQSGVDHPSARTVYEVFGAWNRGMLAAGFTPRRGPRRWTDEEMVEVIIDWLFAHGRWPTFGDWDRSTEAHPHANMVAKAFGSWGAALQRAGRVHELRGRVWVDTQPEYVEPRCGECGTELDNYTSDCGTCIERARGRRRRETEREARHARAA